MMAASSVTVKEEPFEPPEIGLTRSSSTAISPVSNQWDKKNLLKKEVDFEVKSESSLLNVPEEDEFDDIDDGPSEAVDEIHSEIKALEEIFSNYVPSNLVETCQPHPADVVESSSLAGVRLPEPTYSVREAFPEVVFKEGKLSSLQIEGIHYAGQRHQLMLPSGERAGFFIADAAGVGKGRQVAGTILDNYVRGRKKHVWFSTSPDLFLDARRDVQDIGAFIKIHDGFKTLNKHKSGVLFCTYSEFTSGGGDRLKQMVDWLGGPNFNGCLIFDECHKAKNYLKKGSQKTNSRTAKAVVDLQDRLPLARVVYCSATGVSNIKHMVFMKRLGLWGKGALFRSIQEMIGASNKRGLGFAEMLAMEMKSRGMYVSRGLSFKNTEFSIVQHQCTNDQVAIYDRAVSLWSEALIALGNSFHKVDLPGQDRAVLTMQYWTNHQRFFRDLCLSMKVPCVVEEAKEALKTGHSVVIGLQSTGESATSFAMARGHTGFISTCRETFQKFIRHQFPVKSVGPDAVEIGWCVEAREELLNLIDTDALLKKLPINALDALIEELGGRDLVAEMTGRRGRMLRGKDGKVAFESRGSASNGVDSVNNSERDQFMSGKKRVGIISDAASTGISLHADVMSKGAEYRRVHITLELPWSAEKTVQQLGRSHRSFQASAPIYKLITTDLGGEMRFASAVSKNLQQLGALSRGDRRAGSGMDIEALNFETQYGRKALKDIYSCVNNNRVVSGIVKLLKAEEHDLTAESVVNYLKDALVRMDLAFKSVENGKVMVTDVGGDVKKFLNRLLGIPVFLQNLTFRCFWECLRLRIDGAKRDGKYDDGVVNIRGKISLAETPRPVFHLHGEDTKLVTLKVDRGMSWDEAKNVFEKFTEKDKAGFFISSQFMFGRRSVALASIKTDDRRYYRICRPNTGFTANPDLREEFLRKYVHISPEEAEEEWRKDYERSETECIHGQNCQQAPSCNFGKRVYEISMLAGSGIIPKLEAMEEVRAGQFSNEQSKYDRLSTLTIIRVDVEGVGPMCGVRFPARWIPLLKKQLKWHYSSSNQSDCSSNVTDLVEGNPIEEKQQKTTEENLVIPELKEKVYKEPPNLYHFFPVISKEEYLDRLSKESVFEVVDLSADETVEVTETENLDVTEPELAILIDESTPGVCKTPANTKSGSGRHLRPRMGRNYTERKRSSVSSGEEEGEDDSEEEQDSTPKASNRGRKRKGAANGSKGAKAKKARNDEDDGEIEILSESYKSPLDNPGVRDNLNKNRRQTNLTEYFKK